MKRLFASALAASVLLSVAAQAQISPPAPPPTATMPAPVAALPAPGKPAAQAEQPKTYHSDEVLPLEVALLYHKLLNKEPPYDFYIYSNKQLIDSTKGFGQAAVLDQQRDMMKDIYDKSGPDHPITARYKVTMTGIIPQTKTVVLNIPPDVPLTYSMGESTDYGIFLHNAKDVQKIDAPYEDGNYDMILSHYNGNYRQLSALLTMKPLTADPQDFMLATGKRVRVILADVVEIKIFDRTGRYVILDKRFNGWKPEELKHDSLLSPDLLPKLQDQNR